MKTILFAIVISGLSWTTCAAGRLTVPAAGVAFGEIPAGEKASASVSIENSGDADLIISTINPCCGAEATLGSGVLPLILKPKASTTLCVSLTPSFPGEFAKNVNLTSNDPVSPLCVIPVTGSAIEPLNATASVRRFTLPAVVAAGFVDGFNPCAFTIVIILAGILAVGGRRRVARLVGGSAFCLGSFLTYMLMGLGLLRALRYLAPLALARDLVMIGLALSLFILALLSFRDAWRYRRTGDFRTITLQLPDRVKKLIRLVADGCWNGGDSDGNKSRLISVGLITVTSLGCGFLVTLMDALCTGQIYVPVLALISREPGAAKALGYLTVYNLAFIAPLITIFVLAALGADSTRMQVWSKRNVVPSKIGLGILFALLGVLVIMPQVGRFLEKWF